MLTDAVYGALYVISTSLLYPVVLSLLVLLIYSLMLLGEFVAESSRRVREPERLMEVCVKFSNSIEDLLLNLKKINTTRAFKDFLHRLEKSSLTKNELEKILQEIELKFAKELEMPRIMSRIGPMLGLMGTLIPLGPALLALSQGNIEQLAKNLITAFATTVLGLIVGGTGYVIFTVRKRWYLQDLSDIEFVAKIVGDGNEKKNPR